MSMFSRSQEIRQTDNIFSKIEILASFIWWHPQVSKTDPQVINAIPLPPQVINVLSLDD